MKHSLKTIHNKYDMQKEKFSPNLKSVSLIFLGVGLTMFMLNITSMLVFLPVEYSYIAFDISSFASIMLILFPVYYLTNLK